MLGTMLDRHPMTRNGSTLREIVESDIRNEAFSLVTIIGRSGSGKTATVIELAKYHFVIYFLCTDPRSEQTFEVTDPNFVQLGKDVENMCIAFTNSGQYSGLKELDTGLKTVAAERIEIEFLARLIFLWILFRKYPQLTPEQFFREQLNGGAKTVETVVTKLRKYHCETINSMLSYVEDHLSNGYLQGRGLAIALDEAQVAIHNILGGKLISPRALMNKDFLDHKGHVQDDARRGFFTPLSATLGFQRATLITLGTSLSLQDADHVYNAIDKETRLKTIMHFSTFNEQDQRDVLSEVIDISDCYIPAAKRRMLTGRPHFSIRVVERLITFNHSDQNSKQRRLENAFDETISQIKTDLEHKVQELITSDKSGEIVKLLSRMVIAHKLWIGKVWFANETSDDFIQKSLCSLREKYSDVYLTMDEPLVVEVVEKKLRELDVDATYVQYLDQFNRLIENLGVKSTANGDMLEPLIRRSLQRFNDIDLANLPFLKGIKLPSWCIGLKLQIDEINTAPGFGFNDEGIKADLEFLKAPSPYKMLIESPGTRHNGAWFFNNHYAGSLAIKLYTEPLEEFVHKKNETSSDLRGSFLKSDDISRKESLQNIRDEFVASGVPARIKGILRIHLEFPSVSGTRPVTRVETDRTTGEEDIMVYIDSENMDEFFYEGIPEN
ncbi:hypothetical protein DFQ28_001939, partial [Apophysomyces sp. BC1034]